MHKHRPWVSMQGQSDKDMKKEVVPNSYIKEKKKTSILLILVMAHIEIMGATAERRLHLYLGKS